MKSAFVFGAAVLSAATFSCAASAQEYPAIWSGLYAGVNAGYGDVSNAPGGLDISGGLLGFHLGYNYQLGRAVIGAEGDYMGSWMEDGPFAVDDLASIRARAGYTFGNALLYGTVGYAWANTSFGSNDFDGLVLGAGVEYKFADNWSARVEGLQYWLDPSGGSSDELDVGAIRAGLTFHLN